MPTMVACCLHPLLRRRGRRRVCLWRRISASSSLVDGALMRCTLTISPVAISISDGISDSPTIRRGGGIPRSRGEARQATFMGFPFLLLERLGTAFAEVGEVDEADGLRLEEIFGGGALGGETIVVGRGRRWYSRRIVGWGVRGSHGRRWRTLRAVMGETRRL